MLAPEPVFTPRGTPFSVVGRLKAYSDAGVKVDLVTYHLGRDVDLPGVTFHRIPRLPGVKHVKVGPSLVKPALDALLFGRALGLLRRGSYDLVHTHEEAGLIGAFFRKSFGIAHLYDMHSSLSQQMTNFRFTSSRHLIRLMERVEDTILRNADGVLVICEDLRRYVEKLGYGEKLTLLENTIDYSFLWDSSAGSAELRLNGAPRPWVVYVGTFEPYQGIDLLLRSVHLLQESGKWRGSLILAGGNEEQVRNYRRLADELGVDGAVRFLGTVDPGVADRCIREADILVSPRISGTNTPLKIYSYLRSAKPIVATEIWSHTQVLDGEVSLLVRPEPESFARALAELIESEALRRDLGERAGRYAQQRFSDDAYRSALLGAAARAIRRRNEACAA